VFLAHVTTVMHARVNWANSPQLITPRSKSSSAAAGTAARRSGPGELVARRGLALIPERARQARAHQDRQADHALARAQVVVVRDLSPRQRMDQVPEMGLICEPKHDGPHEQPSRLKVER
jgi:hypothetical protein